MEGWNWRAVRCDTHTVREKIGIWSRLVSSRLVSSRLASGSTLSRERDGSERNRTEPSLADSIALHKIALHSIALHSIALDRSAHTAGAPQHNRFVSCIRPHDLDGSLAPEFVALRCVVLRCAVLYYTIPCCNVHCFPGVHCTALHAMTDGMNEFHHHISYIIYHTSSS